MAERAQIEAWQKMPERDLLMAIDTGMIQDPEVLKIVAQHFITRVDKSQQLVAQANTNLEKTRITRNYFPANYDGLSTPRQMRLHAQNIIDNGVLSLSGYELANYMFYERSVVASLDQDQELGKMLSLQAGNSWNEIMFKLIQYAQ